ncbi:hypothetical protein OAB57_03590 [Bacteriovoracaceae bacterium]|nr:hypothetical protein [Bacteriovoracaceae bacterium]
MIEENNIIDGKKSVLGAEYILSKEDHQLFLEWLGPKWSGSNIESEYEKKFRQFWEIFFTDDITLDELHDKFEKALSSVRSGPIFSWLNWVKAQHICFFYTKKDISILSLSRHLKKHVSEVSFCLWSFFTMQFPHYESYFSNKLQIGDITCKNIHLTYELIEKDLDLNSNFDNNKDEEILNSLEITIYREWDEFISLVRKQGDSRENKEEKVYFYRRQMILFRDFFVLVSCSLALILLIKKGDEYYDSILGKQVDMFPAKFNVKAKFFTEKYSPEINIELKKDLEDFQKLKKDMNLKTVTESEERFVTESEVVLASLDLIPQDLEGVGFEHSEYEEMSKGGYRDERYGRKEVYRLMIKSVNPNKIAKSVIKVLLKYNVEQVNTVKPGTVVPGGIYYNLFVPRPLLKEFLHEINQLGDASLHVSKTRRGVPFNKSKVFIWVKRI